MPALLVVDDEPSILLAFRRAFRTTALDVLCAQSAGAALELARQQRPDVVVLDVHLPDANGLDTFRRFREVDARCPVIFITGKSTTDTAIKAVQMGAYEYLFKPLDLGQLRQVIDRALATRRLMHVPAVLAEVEPADERADAIVGRCPAMKEVYKAIGRVAGQEGTVLIVGETGTGKELVARAIYQHSPRARGPFLAINCAAIPETLLESELFGHEKGAFTGADRRHIGMFERCSGGTLFLDEVGDLTPLAQSKMLRVLQEQTFERLGGSDTVQADVRVLAATNQDLEALVARGQFRQDLYYRLSTFTIRLPPLRERGDDLPLLVSHFLRHFNRDLDREVREVAPEVMALLRAYPWPGNVRELQSVLRQALLHATGPVLLPEFLPARVGAKAGGPEPAAPDADGEAPFRRFVEERIAAGTEKLHAEVHQHVERLLLSQVLHHTRGNQRQAARILGITRGYLRKLLLDLGISIARTVEVEEP